WSGIELFWKGTFPPMRAYQFYSELTIAAERDQQWPLGHLLANEAVGMSVVTGNRLMEAMARQRLAMFARRVGKQDEALAQLRQATLLLQPLGAEPSVPIYSAESAIAISEAYLESGDLDSAERLFRTIHLDRDSPGSLQIQISYHRVLGLI